MRSPLRLARRLVMAVWIGLIALVLSLVAVSHVAPAMGYRLVIIKGPSMEPTLPVGALTFERPIAEADLAPDMVVTFVLPNRAVITHRIVRVTEINGARMIETRGDANAAPDPALHPASGVTGRAEGYVPIAGFLMAFLSMPLGMLSAISLIGSLLLLVWLLDAMAQENDPDDVGSVKPLLQPTA